MATYVVAALVAATLLWALGRRRSSPGERRATRQRGPYAALSIEPSPSACARARDLAGRRFLRQEAPVLPLTSCGQSRCRCRLRPHRDRRRDDQDRRLGVGLQSELYLTNGNRNRRAGLRGRRVTDRC